LKEPLDPVAGRAKEFAKRKCKCIQVSRSNKPQPKSAKGEHSLLIGDSDRKIARLYDVPLAGEGSAPNGPTTIRSVFIIGPDKKIKQSLSYPRGTGRNFEEILRHIDLMQLLDKDWVDVARQMAGAASASNEVRITWATTDNRYKVVFSEAALNELSKFSGVGRSDLASIVAAVESMLLNDKDTWAHQRFPEDVGVKERLKRLESCCRKLLNILTDNKTIPNMMTFESVRSSQALRDMGVKFEGKDLHEISEAGKRHGLEVNERYNEIWKEYKAVRRLWRRATDMLEKADLIPKHEADKRSPVDRRKMAIATCAIYIWIFLLGRKRTLRTR
jgi:AhpC/TSA family